MATSTIIRGKTLPDSGVKNDLHELIDLSTVSVTNIVDADISSSAAISGSKINPNFGAQDILGGDCTLSGDAIISGTTDMGSDLTLTGAFGVTGASTFTGDVTIDGDCSIFGAWASKSNNTIYQADTDGFVTAFSTSNGTVSGITDSNSSPSTVRVSSSEPSIAYGSICFPVKKDDYWKTTGAATVYWIPLG